MALYCSKISFCIRQFLKVGIHPLLLSLLPTHFKYKMMLQAALISMNNNYLTFPVEFSIHFSRPKVKKAALKSFSSLTNNSCKEVFCKWLSFCALCDQAFSLFAYSATRQAPLVPYAAKEIFWLKEYHLKLSLACKTSLKYVVLVLQVKSIIL